MLGAVKTEFETFEAVITAAQNRLEQANKELDKLVGVRTRQIRRRLSEVSSLSQAEAKQILDGETEPSDE